MKIDRVDLFYLAMPQVRCIGDGSQDTLLVRVVSGTDQGWGECAASPLTSIASFVCPMSHSACRPVRESVLGQRLDQPSDIARIGNLVRARSFDLLQSEHMLSGIDIAMWDLLGRRLEEPVFRLLGHRRAYPKIAYASVLFGPNPAATYAKVTHIVRRGFRAIKLGWGPFGQFGIREDRAQLEAARDAAGADRALMIDAGTVWAHRPELAQKRLRLLKAVNAFWLEEPFSTSEYGAYRTLSRARPAIPLAAGEGAHNPDMARNLIEYTGIRFIQIDAGRIGGISSACLVSDHARRRRVKYVNHTFTSNLSLSASVQPYAGLRYHDLCEFPIALSPLAENLGVEKIAPDRDGLVTVPDRPGIGIDVDQASVRQYVQEVDIAVDGRRIFHTPR